MKFCLSELNFNWSGMTEKVVCSASFCLKLAVGRMRLFFTVWLRNRIISAGLELVLSHKEILRIVSYYRKNFRKKNLRINPYFVDL